MKGNDIREAYLKFFANKGHLVLDSFSLVPDNDPSLLLIGAGMAPLKPFFTGKLVPPSHRITTCQKCMRTGDLENVGRTARHHTFFEMLGNFSFGDYFKADAISWAWEFLTDTLHLEKEKLYVTVYPDDQEAYDYWIKVGVPADHISRLEDNFWEIGEGPCGPDSEIFYDLGEARGCGEPDCAPGCDCDRYLEIWNLVFTQFNKTADGEYVPLAKKNIDTGAGLERLAAVMQNKETNFETDLIFPIIEKTMEIANVEYHENQRTDISLKVIADHIRAVTALIADGVLPSNEGRGYVLRRLLRRAVRHGRLLGINGLFLVTLVDIVMDILGPGIPGLREREVFVKRVVRNEEERFNQTLEQGLDLLHNLTDELKAQQVIVIPGEEVFKLYDTYGFPWELTEEIAGEAGFSIDKEGFDKSMEAQRTRAREARAVVDAKVATPDITFLSEEHLTVDENALCSEVLMLGKESVAVEEATDGEEVTVIFRTTPFHAEGGGQIGDSGYVTAPMGKIFVETAKKLPEGTTYHVGYVTEGTVRVGDEVQFAVDTSRRLDIARNHTATHLLHASLRDVLGTHVTQAGSLVMPDRLRFDFTHFSPVTEDELAEIERKVNDAILAAQNLEILEMSMADAKEKGAMALFGEKYGETVRVVSIPHFSVELCGGTHVPNTAVIGTFRILSEGGIGSGIRRIEAITGRTALATSLEQRNYLHDIATQLKTKESQISEKISQLQSDLKVAEKEVAKFHSDRAKAELTDVMAMKKTIAGIDVISARIAVTSMEELRATADLIRDKSESNVVLIGMAHEGKANFVCMATKSAVAKGIHCGAIVKATAQMAGGNGGGRADMAQAGAKDADQILPALKAGVETILKQLNVEA